MKPSTHLYINGIAAFAAAVCLLLFTPRAKAQWNQLGGTDTSTTNGFIIPITIDARGNLYADVLDGFKSTITKWDGKVWTKLSAGTDDIVQSKTLATDMNNNVYIAESHKVLRGTYKSTWRNGAERIGYNLAGIMTPHLIISSLKVSR